MKERSIDIIKDANENAGFWPVDQFMKAYSESGALKGCAVAAMNTSSGNTDPDKIAVAVFRIFIDQTELAKTDQKFIVAVGFIGFGDIMTVDIISLDKGYHKYICQEHLKRTNELSYMHGVGGTKMDAYEETAFAPMLVVGAHLKIADDDTVTFFDTSGDYGNKTLFTDANSLATYAADVCGFKTVTTNGLKEKGELFIQEMLQFILKHKRQNDFYEELVKKTTEDIGRHLRPFTPQNIGALLAMKVRDRVVAENGDPLQIMVQEWAGGQLARAITVHSIAKKMADKKKDEVEGR